MTSRCEQALSLQQCCFQGTLRSIELRGAGRAAFTKREGFSGDAIQTVRFRPSVHLHSIDGPKMAQTERPTILDGLPLSGSQDHYRVIYSLPKPNTLGIELRLETESHSGLSFRGKTPGTPGLECETKPCEFFWPMPSKEAGEKERPPLYVDVEMSPEGTATLSNEFPWTSMGRVLSAKLEVAKGTLYCAGESAAKSIGGQSKALRWQVDGEEANATRIEVSPLVMMKGELWAEVVVDGVKPEAAPIKPEAAPMGWGWVMAVVAILAIAGLALAVWLWNKPRAPLKAKKIFYSYAEKDKAYHEKLDTHLALLKRQGLIDTWHSEQIDPGDHKDKAISKHLEEVDIVLLLISSDYVASDTLWNQQMLRALELQKTRGTRVIPIYLRPSDQEGAPYANLQGLPSDEKPISKWDDQDEALMNVAEGLRKVLEPPQHPPKAPAPR